MRPRTPLPQTVEITRRQREIATLVAAGYRNHEIADHLGICERTVETHRDHMYERLGVHGVADVTRLAIREGWMTVA